MILFNQNTPALLAKYLINEHVGCVSLASYGFSLQIGDVLITCNERVVASIEGVLHEWGEAPTAAPWGLLLRQQVTDISLVRPDLLRIALRSADYIEIETVEGQYESVIIDLPRRGETIVMEIY